MAIQFDDIQFPVKISYGCAGGPEYRTTIIPSDSGAEQRQAHWSIGKGRWDVSHAQKSRVKYRELVNFFRARKGKARAFRFKDWFDYFIDVQELVNPGSGTDLQIIKTYPDAISPETRIIKKPVISTVTLLEDSTTLTEGSDFDVDYTTGIITMATAINPASNFFATCEFDTPARFDIDHMKATRQAMDVIDWEAIPIIEVLL